MQSATGTRQALRKMGKIADFFNNPGARPDMYHCAPTAEPFSRDITDPEPIDCPKEEEKALKKYENELTITGSSTPNVLDDDFSSICESHKKNEVKRNVRSVAETCITERNEVTMTKNGNVVTSRGFNGLRRGFSDRCMDKMVAFAGSQFIFFLMWIILIVWCVIGIVYKAPSTWQVVMQDGQSIQCYIWDTLLMRQQLISTHEQFSVCGEVRSRTANIKRLLCDKPQVGSSQSKDVKVDDDLSIEVNSVQPDFNFDDFDVDSKLPSETWYDKFCSFTSIILGSLCSIIIYWIGIFVWIGTGALWIDAGNTPPYTGEKTGNNPRLGRFSNNWQLYINSATAVVLLVCSVFLQNIRARHDKYIDKFIGGIIDMDIRIERETRSRFRDFETPNPVVIVKFEKRGWGQKIIDFYADIVGTGIGVLIAIAVFAAWLGVGHLMGWDDDWWLIIGTYTGLAGYLDGFVIREAYQRITKQEEDCYRIVAQEDQQLFQLIGIKCPVQYSGLDISTSKSLNYKISAWINWICSCTLSVLFAVSSVIGLIIAASAMRWSTMGQLIANTPTMIIEGFFMIVLIQAHNYADERRRIEVSSLYARRCILLEHIKRGRDLYF